MNSDHFESASSKPESSVREQAGAITAEDGGLSMFQKRLRDKIRQLRDSEKGYLPLENAIRATFGCEAENALSRRQLQKIAEGKDIPLHFHQLDILDRFLRLRGHGSLADMLNPRSVLRFMAEEGRIGFMIGSRPLHDESRHMDVFSRWDVKSMQTIQKELYATGKPLQIVIEDVLFRDREQSGKLRDLVEAQADEDWLKMVGKLDAAGDSLIVLGSPRVNHGAEKVLASMLGVKPFRPWPAERMRERPFAFFWPDWCRNPERPESCLHFDPSSDPRVEIDRQDLDFIHALQSGDRSAALQEERPFDCAIVANGVFYPIRGREKRWRSYAIIAARRGWHRTFACICGATGPATLAGAQVFDRFEPPYMDGRDDRVAWCLVQADVEDERETRGKASYRADPRVVVSPLIVENKIHFYAPPKGFC